MWHRCLKDTKLANYVIDLSKKWVYQFIVKILASIEQVNTPYIIYRLKEQIFQKKKSEKDENLETRFLVLEKRFEEKFGKFDTVIQDL